MVQDERAPDPHLNLDRPIRNHLDAEEQVLAGRAENPLGQIEVRSDDEALRQCVRLAEIFAEARFVIAVAAKKQAWQVWHKLTDGRSMSALVSTWAMCSAAAAVAGCTPTSIARSRRHGDEILLLPYPHQMGGNIVEEKFRTAAYSRVTPSYSRSAVRIGSCATFWRRWPAPSSCDEWIPG